MRVLALAFALPALLACGGMPQSPSESPTAVSTQDPTSSSPSPTTLGAPASGAQAVALREVAKLGLRVSGEPLRVFDVVLPPVLNDPNYGPKAASCTRAGYDLDAQVGEPVTFVGHATTCGEDRRIVWVVVHAGAAVCAYFSEPFDSSVAPGIYAVTDCGR